MKEGFASSRPEGRDMGLATTMSTSCFEFPIDIAKSDSQNASRTPPTLFQNPPQPSGSKGNDVLFLRAPTVDDLNPASPNITQYYMFSLVLAFCGI